MKILAKLMGAISTAALMIGCEYVHKLEGYTVESEETKVVLINKITELEPYLAMKRASGVEIALPFSENDEDGFFAVGHSPAGPSYRMRSNGVGYFQGELVLQWSQSGDQLNVKVMNPEYIPVGGRLKILPTRSIVVICVKKR